ncbi:MAG: methyltransferase domain-containing protein [Nodosilinea sp.]
MTTQPPSALSPGAWENRYQEGTTRWDLGQPAPIFVELLESAAAPPPGAAIVLGAGRGHDALWFAQHGFEVTAVDFAPSAIQFLAQQAGVAGLSITLLQRDIFELVPELQGRFDYVIEHTCFCAIHPSHRPAYVRLVADLLAPRGELLGVFFTHQREGGPPFGTSATEIRQHFAADFDITVLQPVSNSVPTRQGEEHLGRFRRRVLDRG